MNLVNNTQLVNKSEPITVAICTYNNAQLLNRTLAHLEQQIVESRINWSVLVVDNNCTDNTADVVKQYLQSAKIPNLRIVTESRQGLAYARRRGIAEIDTDLIAFVDDDCLLASDWIQQAVDFCHQHPQAGAVGSRVKLLWETEPTEELLHFQGYLASYDVGNELRQLPTRGGAYLVGAGLVVRKSALQASGWLEKIALVGRQGKSLTAGDDSEMVLRIRNAGYQLWYNPAMELQHYIPQRRICVGYFRGLLRGIGRSLPILYALADKQQPTLAVRLRFLFNGCGYLSKMLLSIVVGRFWRRQPTSVRQQIYLSNSLGYLEGAVQLLLKGYQV